MPLVGFELINLSRRAALDRAATGTGRRVSCVLLRADIQLADQLEVYGSRVACRESSLYAVCVLQCAALFNRLL